MLMTPMKSFAALAVTVLALGAPALSRAVDLAPGDQHNVRDRWDAELHTPGVNLASDPSLAGTVVAEATRPFSFEVTFRSNMSEEVRTWTLYGELKDWVVRREDTGTLDFYMVLNFTPPEHFAGSVTRPWLMGASGIVPAHWRDDGVPDGNPPTDLGLALTGDAVNTVYYATDDGTPNWISGSSAPVLFRSDLSAFTLGTGSISYSYSPVFGSNSGGTTLQFFMPAVPEPSTLALLLLGLTAVTASGLSGNKRRRH